MAGQIISLIINALIDLTGHPFFVGVILMILLSLILLATNLPFQAVIIVTLGFTAGLVLEGWLDGWILAIAYILVGAIFFWVLYKVFES